MTGVSLNLLAVVQQSMPLLRNIPDEDASAKPAPGKWSRKEIIGHLLDSACNNQQKFVRTILEDENYFPPYAQDEWVDAQRYNDADWQDLLNLWEAYNIQLAHLIKNIPDNALQNKIFIGDKGPYTLGFIAADYVEHMKHHLMAVLPEANFLSNYFKMIY
jgi:hypothetical protein